MPLTAIPASIDAALMALSGGKGYSPPLRKGLDRISLYVMRAFGAGAPDAATLRKAIIRAEECVALAVAAGAAGGLPDAAAGPHLEGLLVALRAQLEAAAAAPVTAQASETPPPPQLRGESMAPRESFDSPRNVATPSTGLSRTLPLSLRPGAAAAPPDPLPAPPLPPLPAAAAPYSPSPYQPPPAVRREEVAPPAPPSPPVAPARPPSPSPRPQTASARATAAGAKRVTVAIFSKVASLYTRRQCLLDDPLTVWRDYRQVDTQIHRAMQAMKWMGDDGATHARAALAAVEDAADTFAAVTGLLQTGGFSALDKTWAAPATVSDQISGALILAFRLAGEPSLQPRVTALFRDAASEEVRASALSALADHGLVPVDELLAALDDSSDAVAMRAATLLAGRGRSVSHAAAVQSRLRAQTSAGRRCALLFAATALGAAEALPQLQDMFDQDEPVTAMAIDALVIAGGPDDAARLLRLAARQPELALIAALAIGHLGDPATVAALATLDLPAPFRHRAMATTLGDPAVAQPRSGRLLYGAPWTVIAAVRRLEASDELLRSRSWYALEAVVRARARVDAVLDASASAATQERAAAQIRKALLPSARAPS